MAKPLHAVLADALRLDDRSKAQLASELIASLDGPADPTADRAWGVEIERRIADIEAGKVALEPWKAVKRRIEKDILGR
jgi:putative addiction module component (TIGR02574 family)